MQFNNPASTKKLETKNMPTQSITNSINRSPWRRAFLFIPLVLVCAAAYGPAPALRAQQPSAFTLSSATRHGLPRLPGRVAPSRDAAQTLTSPLATPAWSSNFRAAYRTSPDIGITGHSAVYDQATNTMIVFGGFAIASIFGDTNAVVLYAPANGDGLYSTLIANGTAGSPVARDSHTAVYDSANNRMTG